MTVYMPNRSSSKREVFVNAMNAIDELNMKSPDKLLSGEAIVEIITRDARITKHPLTIKIKEFAKDS